MWDDLLQSINHFALLEVRQARRDRIVPDERVSTPMLYPRGFARITWP